MKHLLGPWFKSLFLAAKFITASDAEEPLSAQIAQQCVDVFTESAKVRVRARAESEHCVSVRDLITKIDLFFLQEEEEEENDFVVTNRYRF